jgi:glycine oxidase
VPAATSDILLIGGGVIGLTTALTLADRGASVTLIDRQQIGREASWAGAGMLPPGNLARATTSEARLRSYSHSLWHDFAASLFERTGIDNGYHICGALDLFDHVSPDDAPSNQHPAQAASHLNPWLDEGISVESCDRAQLERRVADLSSRFQSGFYLPDFAQVRNPRHLQSLRAACLQRGVELVECVEGTQFEIDGDLIRSVKTSHRTFSADQICVTAGAWTTSLLQTLGFTIPVKPVRGQIVQLQLPSEPFRCCIELGRRYLVPRRDGLILIGSTEEDAGFVKQNTTECVAELLSFAKSLIPTLAQAEVVRTWAGLRPGSPDELPLLGTVPGYSNLFVGAGHFRSGLQMSPATGRILADLMMGMTPEISLDGFQPDRFAPTTFNSSAPRN